MRPRERDQAASPPSPMMVAPTRAGGSLSSMVVRPSDNGVGGGSNGEAGEARAEDERWEEEQQDHPSPLSRLRASPRDPYRRDSPRDARRRDSPLVGLRHRDGSSPRMDFRRREGSLGFRPRSERFHGDQGYGVNAGSISPPRRHRLDDSHFVLEFNHPVRPSLSRGFRGGRGGRFREVSPPYGRGRGGRSSGRGFNAPGREGSPPDGEYVLRNDPNLSPREGDWICRNPSCGNLNFARRTYCNKCNEFRFAPEQHGPSRDPRRSYYRSPPLHGSPPRFSGPPVERGQRRNMNGYLSPPRGWGTEDPTEFVPISPVRRGGRLPDRLHRERLEYREEEYRERRKFDWPAHEGWDRRDPERDGFAPERRGFDRRPPSPRAHWVRDARERSRSPIRERPLQRPFIGRGRGGRRYDSSYLGRGRGEESDVHGRGYRRGNDSFMGRGRGAPWKERGSSSAY